MKKSTEVPWIIRYVFGPFVFLVSTIWFLDYLVYLPARNYLASSWASTPGVLIKIDYYRANLNHITYTYVVNGISYVGHRHNFSLTQFNRGILLPNRLLVYYNPSRPSDSVLTISYSLPLGYFVTNLLFFGVFGFLGFFAYMYPLVKKGDKTRAK